MINVTVRTNFSSTRKLTRMRQQELEKLPREFEKVVKANTPINSGNARRNTSLVRSTRGKFTVRSHYPYAVRLNEGWSKQAVDGFVKPSLDWLAQRIKQIFGKK